MKEWIHSRGIKANHITTVSLITGLWAANFLHKRKYIPAALLYVISYACNCIDGDFARTYKQVTKFSYYYDRIASIVVNSIIFHIVFNIFKLPPRIRIVLYTLLTILTVTSWIHQGCVDKIYGGSQNQTLNRFNLCFDTRAARITRYVSMGTYVVFFATIIALFSASSKSF